MDTNISQPYLQAHFQRHTSPSTAQSFVKKLAKTTQRKIEIKKIYSPSENKKYPTIQFDTTNTMKRNIANGLQTRWKEGQLIAAHKKNGSPHQHLW